MNWFSFIVDVMTFPTKTRWLTILFVVTCVTPSVIPQSIPSRTYRMGSVGNLEMTVPSNWQEVSKSLDKPQAVTLAYHLPSRTDFYMKVTAVWISAEARASSKDGGVRRAVEDSARGIVGYSKPLPTLTQIFSARGSGYYFQAPAYDRFPIGEFHYITAGVLDIGEVRFIFTTYSNTKELPEIADSLRVVESARFVATKTNHHTQSQDEKTAAWQTLLSYENQLPKIVCH